MNKNKIDRLVAQKMLDFAETSAPVRLLPASEKLLRARTKRSSSEPIASHWKVGTGRIVVQFRVELGKLISHSTRALERRPTADEERQYAALDKAMRSLHLRVVRLIRREDRKQPGSSPLA